MPETILYKCASPNCPGYPYRASERIHPVSTCGLLSVRLEDQHDVQKPPVEDPVMSHIPSWGRRSVPATRNELRLLQIYASMQARRAFLLMRNDLAHAAGINSWLNDRDVDQIDRVLVEIEAVMDPDKTRIVGDPFEDVHQLMQTILEDRKARYGS